MRDARHLIGTIAKIVRLCFAGLRRSPPQRFSGQIVQKIGSVHCETVIYIAPIFK